MTAARFPRIAAAQSGSIPGDVAANVAAHLRLVARAQEAGVDVLVFPELSLCGYEPALLRDCLLAPDDILMAPLRARATAAGMTVIVGAPLAPPVAGTLPYIGALRFGPDGEVAASRKRHLHPGEERFAQAGAEDAHCFGWGRRTLALGICADVSQRAHPAAAAALGASLYLASMLVSEGGYAHDSALLREYARDFGMVALLANHGAPSGGYACAGRSAIWDAGGGLIAQAPGGGECLVLARHDGARWSGQVLAV